jgi:hypothetical protein
MQILKLSEHRGNPGENSALFLDIKTLHRYLKHAKSQNFTKRNPYIVLVTFNSFLSYFNWITFLFTLSGADPTRLQLHNS